MVISVIFYFYYFLEDSGSQLSGPNKQEKLEQLDGQWLPKNGKLDRTILVMPTWYLRRLSAQTAIQTGL